MRPVAVGIDTIAYTCSVAVMDLRGELLSDVRIPLEVRPGELGLRQAEAVYQHVRRLPEAVAKAFDPSFPQMNVRAVAVSRTPRPQEDSFMPVFLVGHAVASVIASTHGVPCWEASHQEGHIWAALWALPPMEMTDILAVHLSGGTTEAVLVQGVGQEHRIRPRLSIVAATGDISAGQFVDRVGNALGLPFPAGPHLERLAEGGEPGSMPLPVSARCGCRFPDPKARPVERSLWGRHWPRWSGTLEVHGLWNYGFRQWLAKPGSKALSWPVASLPIVWCAGHWHQVSVLRDVGSGLLRQS